MSGKLSRKKTPQQRVLEQQGKGVLRDMFVKPFPVRCAIEVGTGGMAKIIIARIDANQNAVRDVLATHEVPLNLTRRSGMNVMEPTARKQMVRDLRTIMKGIEDRKLGAVEFSGLLTWPFNVWDDGEDICKELTRKLKVNFHVADNSESGPDNVDRLAFDGFAAASKCLNKYNLVCMTEMLSPEASGVVGNGVQFLGLMPEAGDSAYEEEGVAAPGTVRQWTPSSANLKDSMVKFTLPLGTMHAHRLLLTEVQQRPESHINGRSSPNPVLRQELCQCRDILHKMVEALLPDWLKEKTSRGCMFAATSRNGGLFNIAARAAGQTHIGLDNLDMNGEYKHCGLTDILIGENYPNPHLVLPQIALAGGIMRALVTPRVVYCPDVSIAESMLINPRYWLFAREAELAAKFKKPSATAPNDNFSEVKQRKMDLPFQGRDRFSPNKSADSIRDDEDPRKFPHPNIGNDERDKYT